jgi:hypothetical protein
VDRYTKLRPASEYDGKSPARWFAVHIDEYSDQPKLVELQVMIGVQLSDRCCFAYVHEFSLEDLPCNLIPITKREALHSPPPAEVILRRREHRKKWEQEYKRKKSTLPL